MKRLTNILALLCAVPPVAAMADSFDKGERALQRGDHAEAVRLFSKSARREAAFRMGELAEKGAVPGCDLNCALQWYTRSADAGYLDALNSAAMLYWNNGQKEKGVDVFRLAARWNEPHARDFLSSYGYEVPAADLWEAHVQRQRIAAAEAEVRRAEQEIALAQVLAAAPSWGAPPQATQPSSGYGPVSPSTSGPLSSSAPQSRAQLCPNGQYVYGASCQIAPDGSYVGGTPTIAPNGSYVAGSPRIAPDGSYVGGSTSTMCPDGSYVGGSRCVLTPNGAYVGAP